MIKNYMEDVVSNLLPGIINQYKDVCKCEKCMDDIKAIALNNLKPRYAVTDQGKVFLKINELIIQFTTDATTEIVKAIEIVSKNCKHS